VAVCECKVSGEKFNIKNHASSCVYRVVFIYLCVFMV
jgi:hypothetical protein